MLSDRSDANVECEQNESLSPILVWIECKFVENDEICVELDLFSWPGNLSHCPEPKLCCLLSCDCTAREGINNMRLLKCPQECWALGLRATVDIVGGSIMHSEYEVGEMHAENASGENAAWGQRIWNQSMSSENAQWACLGNWTLSLGSGYSVYRSSTEVSVTHSNRFICKTYRAVELATWHCGRGPRQSRRESLAWVLLLVAAAAGPGLVPPRRRALCPVQASSSVNFN